MKETTVFRKCEGLIMEEVEGAYLLMNEADDQGKGVYISNTAIDIFNLCNGKNTLNDIIASIMDDYEVDMETCCMDIENCLESLIIASIIEEC